MPRGCDKQKTFNIYRGSSFRVSWYQVYRGYKTARSHSHIRIFAKGKP